MTRARIGNKVKIRYTGKFKNGELFDVSCSREPIEFTLGRGEVLRDFAKAVLGMVPGENKTITVPPNGDVKTQRGNRKQGTKHMDQEPLNVCAIRDVKKGTGFFGRGHPLSKRTLVFDLELVQIS